MTNEEQNGSALVATGRRQVDRAIRVFEKLEDQLPSDTLVMLARGNARPSRADWVPNPKDDFPVDLEDVGIFETSSGVVSLWIPVDWPDETPQSRWWHALEVAGLAFDRNPEIGRRQIVMELLRRCDEDGGEHLVRVENAIRRVLEVLDAAESLDRKQDEEWDRQRSVLTSSRRRAIADALWQSRHPMSVDSLRCVEGAFTKEKVTDEAVKAIIRRINEQWAKMRPLAKFRIGEDGNRYYVKKKQQ